MKLVTQLSKKQKILLTTCLAIISCLVIYQFSFTKYAYAFIRETIANFSDPNKNYVHSQQDLEQMAQNSSLCFKNTDCQHDCQKGSSCWEYGLTHDCNSSIYNRNYSGDRYATLIGCPSYYGYPTCEDNRCRFNRVLNTPKKMRPNKWIFF